MLRRRVCQSADRSGGDPVQLSGLRRRVRYRSAFAGVVAQIEPMAVAAKVRVAQVVRGADHAALDDREGVFDRMGVLDAAGGDMLAGAVSALGHNLFFDPSDIRFNARR